MAGGDGTANMPDLESLGELEGDVTETVVEFQQEPIVEFEHDQSGIEMSEVGTKDYYLQKFKPEWQRIPEFADWLRPVPDDVYVALCRYCNTHLRCHKMKLHQHRKSRKHESAVQVVQQHGIDLDDGTAPVPRRARKSRGRRSVLNGEPVRALPLSAQLIQSPDVKRSRYNLKPRTPKQAVVAEVSYADAGRVSYSIGLGEHSVGFIGAGHMAQAVGKAILDKGLLLSSRIWVASGGATSSLAVWRRWGANTTSKNVDVVTTCDIVFVAVPLDQVDAAIGVLPLCEDQQERCFISLVPGLSRHRLQTLLDSKFPPIPLEDEEEEVAVGDAIRCTESFHIIRFMTNLTVRTGSGCCAYSVPRDLPHVWLLCVEVVCGAMGYSCKLDDHQLDAYSAVFCAAPAFTVEFSEALALSAASVAIPWRLSRKMVAQTLVGVGQMLLEEPDTASLMDEMVPPGSSTIAGLAAIQRGEMRSGMIAAVKACLNDLVAEK